LRSGRGGSRTAPAQNRVPSEPSLFFMSLSNLSSIAKTLLLTLLFFSALAACGKKGDPLPPETRISAPVSDLRAWPREGSVFLGWTIPTRNTDGSGLQDLLGFQVFRLGRPLSAPPCQECPQNFEAVAEIDMDYPRGARIEGGRVLWQDARVKPQNEYTYFVMAYDSYKASSPESNRVKVAWDEPPPPPEEVKVRSDNGALEISWRFSPPKEKGWPAVSFNIYRRPEGGGFGFFPVNPEPIRETRTVDGGLQNGSKYFYEVRSVRNFQGTLLEGPASALVEGIPAKTTPPTPPRGLVAAFQEDGVALRWDENPEPDVAGYDVYRRAEGEESFRKINPAPIKEPYFLDRTAGPQKTYTYRLKAVDSSLSPTESDFSQDAEVFPTKEQKP
jgi:predicted small lipoprotein YifL/fibronectin type 3 domain-containing protein